MSILSLLFMYKVNIMRQFIRKYSLSTISPSLSIAALLLAVQLVGPSFGQVTTLSNERELIEVLRSNSPEADKAIACKRLAIYGTSEGVAELASLLSNEKLASWARIALEAIPGPGADEALLKASASLQGKLLIGALNSIGVRRDAAAIDALKGRLKDADPEIASAAAVALGRIGNPAATETLLQELQNAPAKHRTAVAEGLILCAERQLTEGNPNDAIVIYDTVRKATVLKQRILEATRGAILARKDEGIPLLIESLQSNDNGLFQIGLSTAREMAGKEVDKALAKELARTNPERAALLVTAMADRTETVELDAILKVASSGPKPVRLSALRSLGSIGNASCVPPLLAIASDSDSELSKGAKIALAELTDSKVDGEILSRLPKAEGKMLIALIDIVGQRRIEATSELVKSLANADPAIRSSALTSLGATVGAGDLKVLIGQVIAPKQTEDEAVAQKALMTAAVRMPDREACSKQLVDAMEKSSVPTKVALLETLGAVGGTTALKAVGENAKSKEERLMDASTRLLGSWMTIDAAPVLLDLAKSISSENYRNRALKGYIRIARQFTMDEKERIGMSQKAFEACRKPDEMKLVLEVLKRYPNIETLKLALQAAQTAEIKGDAVSAAQAIAAKLGDKKAEVAELFTKAGIDLAKP